MRVIRSAGQNVSPSDDGRLFDQIFDDGLFVDTTITSLGTNNVSIGALYGIICGRDFTAEAQMIQVVLPESDTATGYIYVEIDTSSDDIITIGSALAPFTPTYEDINTNGAVAQMIIAEYEASGVAVTSVSATYHKSEIGSGIEPGSIATIETSPATASHAQGTYIVYDRLLYEVTAAISGGENLVVGTNISLTTVGDELTQLNGSLSGADITSQCTVNSSLLLKVVVVKFLNFLFVSGQTKTNINGTGQTIVSIPSPLQMEQTYFYIGAYNNTFVGEGTAKESDIKINVSTSSNNGVFNAIIPLS